MAKNPNLKPPWKPGQSGNPKGKPIGSRNELSEAFITDLFVDWKAHGSDVIARVRQTKPDIYLRVIGRLIPREMHVKRETLLAGMSNEQLSEIVGKIDRELAARSAPSSDLGAASAVSRDKLN
jgi:hypothetical protein